MDRLARRLVLLPLLATACAHGSAPDLPHARPCRAPARAAPSEAEVRQWSHEVLDAYDRGDVPALGRVLATGFVHFEGGAPTDRETELARLARRRPTAARIAKRSWSHEHVYVRPDHALFLGEASEHMGGNDSHGGSDFDGWYTLVWHRDCEAWRVSLWSWQRGGVSAERDAWNEVYRRARGFKHEPNELLVATVQGVAPGSALDVAMGQGRNALYLASRGWKVTGVDFSDEAIAIARDSAARRSLAIDAVHADLDAYDFGTAKWDLVTMLYATSNTTWIDKIKASLRPGGLFVLEYFHRDGAQGDGFATGELAAIFREGFVVLRDEVVDDAPDWSMDRATLVRFVARKKR